jgi:prolyl 4-hydroxylase
MMRKVSILTGKPVDHCELPQVGRYFPSQQYLQHYDAFDLSTEDGCRFAANGGQRTITVLIYLNDVHRGGATRFPALNLDVQPRRGMALVFFPATIDGMLDKMALHAALPAVDTKFVSQVWIRQSVYAGQPSKRLPHTMGVPFEHSTAFHNRNGQLQQQQQQHEEQQQQTLKHY